MHAGRGHQPWFEHAHDEFAVNMDDRAVVVELVKLASTDHLDPDLEGAVLVAGEPNGQPMGRITLGRGHMAMLPEGAAYRFVSDQPATVMIQTIQGELTQERWSQICQH